MGICRLADNSIRLFQCCAGDRDCGHGCGGGGGGKRDSTAAKAGDGIGRTIILPNLIRSEVFATEGR